MAKYRIPAVFYWPVEHHSLAYSKGYQPLRREAAQAIADVFEVGSHTITHRHLTDLPLDEAEYEIVASREMLSEQFGWEVIKFCPPRGYTNDELTKITLKNYMSQRLTKGPGLIHVHPESGANGKKPWRQKLDEELAKGDVEIWGHSWELDKYDLWGELDEVLRGLSS